MFAAIDLCHNWVIVNLRVLLFQLYWHHLTQFEVLYQFLLYQKVKTSSAVHNLVDFFGLYVFNKLRKLRMA